MNFVPFRYARSIMMTWYLKGRFIELNIIECAYQFEGLIRWLIVYYGTQRVQSIEFYFLEGWTSHCDDWVLEGVIYRIQLC